MCQCDYSTKAAARTIACLFLSNEKPPSRGKKLKLKAWEALSESVAMFYVFILSVSPSAFKSWTAARATSVFRGLFIGWIGLFRIRLSRKLVTQFQNNIYVNENILKRLSTKSNISCSSHLDIGRRLCRPRMRKPHNFFLRSVAECPKEVLPI